MTPPYGECVLIVNSSPIATTISSWSNLNLISIETMKDNEANRSEEESATTATADLVVEALAKMNFGPQKKSASVKNGQKLVNGVHRSTLNGGGGGSKNAKIAEKSATPEIISRSPPKKSSGCESKETGVAPEKVPEKQLLKENGVEEVKKNGSSGSPLVKLVNGSTAKMVVGGAEGPEKPGGGYKCLSEGISVRQSHQSPADFLKNSREKKFAAARRINTLSAAIGVSRDAVTSDLRSLGGSVSGCGLGSTHPRDQKKVEDIEKDFGALSLKSGPPGIGLAGELIQRSPVSVFQHNRHLVTPYSQAATNQRAPSQTGANRQALIQQQQQQQQQHRQYFDQLNDEQRQSIESIQQAYLQSLRQLGQQQQQPFAATSGLNDQQTASGYLSPSPESCCFVQNDQHFSAAENFFAPSYPANASFGAAPDDRRDDPCAYSCSFRRDEDFASIDDEKNLGHGFNSTTNSNKKITSKSNNICNFDQLAELPEQLSDFILKYSRRYLDEKNQQVNEFRDDLELDGQSPACSSPIEARSVPQNSPAVPHGAQNASPATSPAKSRPTPSSPISTAIVRDTGFCVPELGAQTPSKQQQAASGSPELPPRMPQPGRHKKKLREMISDDEFSNAWAWAVRRTQELPGGLYFRDSDGDSSLHIVIWHKDIPKIYSLTELMNRAGNQSFPKPFDLPNKLNETPLFLAVEKRLKEVVAYGLENSENPNISARDSEFRDRGAPLHFAAERGMTEIVEVLCDSPLVDLNMFNGAGLTPLLGAVKNHRHTTEESQFQCLINNKPVIRALLKAGADPKISDVETGKTIFHYAVECMDPDLLQMFRDHMDKETVHNLVNKPCLQGYSPMDLLTRIVSTRGCNYYATEEGQAFRLKMYKTLVEIGAEMPKFTCGADSPDYVYTFDATYFP